ncbi:MAG: class I SAM-dependent methyltransferase, partial [Candidatus Omnitrophica bacterium]|nr:class I SAM-dependent methyltransferase [Candidatus Omnitrophota bacterium]
MEIYDKIAESYTRQSLSDVKRRLTVDYTFLNLIGDVRGKNVLDLACGDGHYCRPLKRSGAAEVVGVDISSRMIDLAKNGEKKNPLGIRYECMDALKLPVVGKFDIALGSFLLHYSRTRDELFAMCRNIYANLRDGGRFVGVNDSPDKPLQSDPRYGITRTCEDPVKEGSIITV